MSNKYYLTLNGELCHYGIKGMKWGVRRYQNKDGSLTSKGKERYGNRKIGMSEYAGMLGDVIPRGYKQDSAKEVLVSRNDSGGYDIKDPLDLDVRSLRWNHEYELDPDSVFDTHMRKINKTNGVENGTINNCTKVAATMCLARMGYDYDAGRSATGMAGAYDYWFRGEDRSVWDSLPEAIDGKFSNTQNGSFGTVTLFNKNGGGGHVFNWERNSKGEFNLYEAQVSEGEKFSGSSPNECFDKYINKRPWFSSESTVRVYDMTNARPDFDAMTEDSVVRVTDDANYDSSILDTITNKLYRSM